MLFENKHNYDGNIIKYTYYGNKKKDDDHVEKTRLINKIFNNNKIIETEKIIKFIRTIFKDYNEVYFDLKIKTKRAVTSIEYINGSLHEYKTKSKIDENTILEINYDINNGIDCLLKNRYTNEEYILKRETYRLIEKEMNHVLDLTNITPLKLSQNDEILIGLYYMFYGQKPDFSDKNIKDKYQSMLHILSEFGLHIPSPDENKEIEFNINDGKVESNIIDNWLSNMTPLANNFSLSNEIIFNSYIVKVIDMVRKEFNSYTIRKSEREKVDIIMDVSKTLYLKSHDYLFETTEMNDNCSQLLSPSKDFESHLKLLKRIETSYDKYIHQSIN